MGQPSTRPWTRDFLHLIALTTIVLAVMLALWVSFMGWPPPPPFLLRDVPFGFVLGLAIGGLAYTVIPFVASRVWHRHVIPRWTAYLAALLMCAVAGTALAATVPFLMGLMPPSTIAVVFLENIRGTIPTTMVIGVLLIVYGSTSSRLEATELALRTQQLERERADKLAAEARLASLASRVQPHFLFNTLNAISALVRESPAQAELTIERLSSLLRASLDSRETIPLDQELKLVGDFVAIQRTRLGERLRCDLSIAPDAVAAVPPFSVQTLVENALTHVGGQRPQGVAVRIVARRSGSDVVVDVTDDGPGFDPTAMKAGHGLDSVHTRLRARYGERAGLEYVRENEGMTVRLRVPVSPVHPAAT